MPATKTQPAYTIHKDGMWLPLWLDLKKNNKTPQKTNSHIRKYLIKNGEPERSNWECGRSRGSIVQKASKSDCNHESRILRDKSCIACAVDVVLFWLCSITPCETDVVFSGFCCFWVLQNVVYIGLVVIITTPLPYENILVFGVPLWIWLPFS